MGRAKQRPERTPDGHYVVIDSRRWRATDPSIPEDERKRLVSELMRARSAVGRALKLDDEAAVRAARDRVQAAKVALGERGAKWWERPPGEGEAPDEPGRDRGSSGASPSRGS